MTDYTRLRRGYRLKVWYSQGQKAADSQGATHGGSLSTAVLFVTLSEAKGFVITHPGQAAIARGRSIPNASVDPMLLAPEKLE